MKYYCTLVYFINTLKIIFNFLIFNIFLKFEKNKFIETTRVFYLKWKRSNNNIYNIIVLLLLNVYIYCKYNNNKMYIYE